MEYLFFQAQPDKPFALSIGAVLINQDKKIICLKKKYPKFGEIYKLPTETVRPPEFLLDTALRGIREEIGAEGEIISFLGSSVSNSEWFGEINKPVIVQKTTIFILMLVTEINVLNKKEDDSEKDSEVVEIEIDELIKIMKKQGEETAIDYFDESKLLERAKPIIQNLHIKEVS